LLFYYINFAFPLTENLFNLWKWNN